MAAAVLPVAAPALLPSIELALEPYPVPDVVAELREAQTVSLLSLLTTLRAEPCVEIAPWARPWVTLWTFSLTSPSEEDIRVTPCPGLPAFRRGWSEARAPCPSVRIDGPFAAQVRHEYPFVRSVTIPAGTYPGQHRDIATIGVDRLLIGGSQLDEALVHDLTRVFIETLPLMASSLRTSIRLTNLEQASATPIPLHAGAARFYRERELMR